MKIPEVLNVLLGEEGINEIQERTKQFVNEIDLSIIGREVICNNNMKSSIVLEAGDKAIVVGVCPYFIQRTTTSKEPLEEVAKPNIVEYLLLTSIGSIEAIAREEFVILEGGLQ